jgi:hypothetical protein
MIKSRRMRWAGHVTRMGEDECIQGFDGKARRKEATTRRTRHRWEDNIKMDLSMY